MLISLFESFLVDFGLNLVVVIFEASQVSLQLDRAFLGRSRRVVIACDVLVDERTHCNTTHYGSILGDGRIVKWRFIHL